MRHAWHYCGGFRINGGPWIGYEHCGCCGVIRREAK